MTTPVFNLALPEAGPPRAEAVWPLEGEPYVILRGCRSWRNVQRPADWIDSGDERRASFDALTRPVDEERDE